MILGTWEKPGNFVFIILYCFLVYCTSHVLCESWSIKKTEHQRTDVQIVVLEKTLEIPLDSKEINQWILKEVNPDYALEGLITEAEAPIIQPPDMKSLMAKVLEKDPNAGKD